MILLNPTYAADDEMKVLCSNGYKQGSATDSGTSRLGTIDVHTFTPNTVRRMREWPLGSLKSTNLSNVSFSVTPFCLEWDCKVHDS